VLNRTIRPQAGIVHEDVQVPQPRDCARDGGLRLGLVGHVDLDDQRAPRFV
jgi:hypothetical protein